MSDFDLINHKLEDLKQDISEIKETVKNTCEEVTSIKEKVIRIETASSIQKVGKEDTLKFLNLFIPTMVSITSIIIAKFSGFIR